MTLFRKPTFAGAARLARLARPAAALAIAAAAGCTRANADHSATRTLRIPVAGAALLRVDAGAGYLRVEGQPGTDQLVVNGIAHATSDRELGAIQLTTHRSADTIFVSVSLPSRRALRTGGSSIDIVLQLPTTLAMDVTDSSGDAIFRNIGPLRINHGVGALDVDTAAGPLDVVDGDGDMVLANVVGSVHIIDGGGSIHLSNIHGSVAIPQDGAGEIQADQVTGDLSVGSKESGEVIARGIGGNLAVTANGNGSIEYHDVKGRVSIPPR